MSSTCASAVNDDLVNEVAETIQCVVDVSQPPASCSRNEFENNCCSSGMTITSQPSHGILLNASTIAVTEMAEMTASLVDDGGNISGGSSGISIMQSSPPPHSYRHSRAYRHFKNPPQPHMCIRTTTDAGEELFINVLSWTRIVIPQEPSDPIPLYGGMRVPPGSARSPPIVFAVMANPEVLKDSGRHSKDPEERRAMVELMCDFVEAMNPGVKLVRNAVILKDRDISGELKDVWNAVQSQRDREREEQMMQQRQQHYHNITTTQQMFPKSPEAVRSQSANDANTEEQQEPKSLQLSGNEVVAQITQYSENSGFHNEANSVVDTTMNQAAQQDENEKSVNILNNINKNEIIATVQQNFSCDQIVTSENIRDISERKSSNDGGDICDYGTSLPSTNSIKTNTQSAIDNHLPTVIHKKSITAGSEAPANTTSATTITTVNVTPPTKKDKLGGFLPNGCIFPRFKNNKHKDKEKEKAKDKEKTLLNALKKGKDKKVAPIEQPAEKVVIDADVKTQYEKNFINLEGEVQKLDLNKIDTSIAGNDTTNNMFIKLKMSSTSTSGK